MKKYNVVLIVRSEEDSAVKSTETYNLTIESATPATITTQALALTGHSASTNYSITITEGEEVEE